MDRATSAPVSIRHMRLDDAAAVADLSCALGYPATAVQIASRFEVITRRGESRIFVAEAADGDVVGWLHICGEHLLESEPFAEIAGLVVAERMRGQGIGAALMAAAERWAQQHRYELVRVRSRLVRVDAHAFYERLGYNHFKTQKNFRKVIARSDW